MRASGYGSDDESGIFMDVSYSGYGSEVESGIFMDDDIDGDVDGETNQDTRSFTVEVYFIATNSIEASNKSGNNHTTSGESPS